MATFERSRPQHRACHVPKDCLETGPLDAENVPEQPRWQRHREDRDKALFKQRPDRNTVTIRSPGSAGLPPRATLAGTDAPAAHAARARAWATHGRRFTATGHGLRGPGEPRRPRPGDAEDRTPSRLEEQGGCLWSLSSALEPSLPSRTGRQKGSGRFEAGETFRKVPDMEAACHTQESRSEQCWRQPAPPKPDGGRAALASRAGCEAPARLQLLLAAPRPRTRP